MSVAVAAASSSSRYPLGHANSHHYRHPLRPMRFISSPPKPYASPSVILWRRPLQAEAPTTFCSAPSLGRVGWLRREGSAWLLSFRAETDASLSADEGDRDSSQAVSALLPLVVVATAVAALGNPATFSWVSKELYAPALGGIMLSIGIQLSFDDFALAFKRPVPLSIGYIAQYMLKPLLGVLIARVFKMPSSFFAGFMLTCCVSGAQLSSYASFLGKGDVALSILLTSYSTISSVVVTPILTRLLIGSVVPVNGIAMAKSILQVVLVPVTLGLLLNTYAKPVVNVIQPVMPFVAMVCTSLCIGSPLAINRTMLLSSQGLMLLLPIVTFHIAAFVVGYWVSKLPQLRKIMATANVDKMLTILINGLLLAVFGYLILCVERQKEPVCRTISVCTGMQSSTLAGLLATQFLGISQAVPAACSVVVMAIFGLTLASYWGSGLRIRDVPSRLFPQASAGARP